MRAVLDPNVLIAAVLSRRGAPAELVLRAFAGEFELVVSALLLAELEQALGYPKLSRRISPSDAAEFVDLLRTAGLLVPDPATAPRRSSDPGDDYLLALAETAGAHLVSGDHHLLELADRFPIVNARAFLDTLEQRR